MREILFRGKRIDNGEWVYGDLLQIPERNRCSIMPQTPVSHNCGVIYETVGQYTGIIDKNGTKIFEGDIVDIFRDFERGIIKWDEDTARFIISSDGIIADFDNYWGKDLEVIGNIYDNSKLL